MIVLLVLIVLLTVLGAWFGSKELRREAGWGTITVTLRLDTTAFQAALADVQRRLTAISEANRG